MNTNNSAMFMNALGQQMAMARGGSAPASARRWRRPATSPPAMAAGPLSAWVSALGGLGAVLGDSNASTLTYNFGGAAAGLDYRLDPRFLVGIGAGYTHGTQWVNSFLGQGWIRLGGVAAYGASRQSGFYADALAGYAYFNNQLQRQIMIPGLQQRTASGSTGANQFLGQAEGGYKLRRLRAGRGDGHAVRAASGLERDAERLHGVGRAVAQPQRGAADDELAAHDARAPTSPGAIGLGNERTLDLALRLGWQHEFADTGRPITAAFAGAPRQPSPSSAPRRSATARSIGFSASTRSPTPPSSTCATTARSAPAPTTMPSTSACA